MDEAQVESIHRQLASADSVLQQARSTVRTLNGEMQLLAIAEQLSVANHIALANLEARNQR